MHTDYITRLKKHQGNGKYTILNTLLTLHLAIDKCNVNNVFNIS